MALRNCSEDYADIIHLPHPVSKTRPRMSMHDRAAQFSPFSALTGHDAAIRETAREMEKQMMDDRVDIDSDIFYRYDE